MLQKVLVVNDNELLLMIATKVIGLAKFAKETITATDGKKALEIFEKAIASNPNEPLINDHLGDSYFKIGDIQKALKHWKTAVDLGSKNLSLPKKIEKKLYYEPEY